MMRATDTSRVGAPLPLAAAVALVLLSSAAYPASDVTFSYACRADHRGLELIPSGPHTYAIVGPYLSQIVTACSPSDRSRCKTWRLHRFDIDCNGARVPWIDIVGAAAAMTRAPAFVQNDQLTIRMGTWWSQPDRDDWGQRPVWSDETGDGGATWVPSAGASNEVQMPPGFAPVIGLQAKIGDGLAPHPASGGVAANDPPPSKINRQGSLVNDTSRTAASPSPAKHETPEATTRKPAVVLDSKAKPDGLRDTVAKSQPAGATRCVADTTASKPEAPIADPATAVVPASSAQPKILNGGGKETGDAATAKGPEPSPSASMAPPRETGALPEKTTAASDSGPPAKPLPEKPQTVAAAEQPSAPSAPVVTTPSDARGSARNGQTQLMVMLAAILATALAAYFWTRRDDKCARMPVAARDFAAAPGPAKEPTMQAAAPDTLGARLRLEAPSLSDIRHNQSEGGLPPAEPLLQPAPIAEWSPTNCTEALLALGAGPDASDAALKKIVDGLRQSWHPDLARSAEDRIARERRMVQINVAWDILSAKPGARAA